MCVSVCVCVCKGTAKGNFLKSLHSQRSKAQGAQGAEGGGAATTFACAAIIHPLKGISMSQCEHVGKAVERVEWGEGGADEGCAESVGGEAGDVVRGGGGWINAVHAEEVGNGVKWKRPKTLKQRRQQQQQPPLSLPFENRTHTHRHNTHRQSTHTALTHTDTTRTHTPSAAAELEVCAPCSSPA